MGAAILVGAIAAVFIAGVADASPSDGAIVPGSAVPIGTVTAGTPFSSGQGINVIIPANSVFTSASTNINIVECAAPNGVIPSTPSDCDGNTINAFTVKPNTDGSINYETATKNPFPVYALPDSVSLGEGASSGGPVCGNTAATECILYIGNNQLDFTQPHVWSQAFFVTPNADDGGENPGDGSAAPAAAVPVASLSSVVAAPATATADGTNVSTVTVTLKGGTSTEAEPVVGQNVTLTSPSTTAVITGSPATTNASGVATFTVSDTTVENVVLTATDTEASSVTLPTTTVDFQPEVVTDANSTVVPSLTTVPASGSTTITVTLQDQASPPHGVVGKTVTLAGTGSAQIVPAATPNVTNSSGVVSFTVSDTAAEAVTFTATDVTDNNLVLSATAQVTFGNLTPSATASTLTAESPALIGAEGTSVTVTLHTSSNAPVPGRSVSLALAPGSSSTTAMVTSSPQITSTDGTATFSVTDSVAETVSFVATDAADSVTVGPASVVFQTSSAPSAEESTVSVPAGAEVADGVTFTPVTVTIRDQFGDPLPNRNVSLAVNANALKHPISVGSSAPGTTNSSGIAEFDVEDATAGTVTVIASDTTDPSSVVTVTQQGTITYVAGPADPQASTLTSSPVNPPSDGKTPVTITALLTDANGNPVSGQSISLAAMNGNSVVSPTTAVVTNNQGVATFTATDATPEVVTYQATDVTDANTVFGSEAVVTFGTPPIPPAVAADSSLVATPTTVPADGTTMSTLSVLLYTGDGIAVPGKTVTLTASGGNSKVTIVNGITDQWGSASFTVTDSSTESVTYTADDTTDNVDLTNLPVTVQFTAASDTSSTSTTTTTAPGSTGSTSTTSTILTSPTTTTTAASGVSTAASDSGSSDTSTDGSSSDGGGGTSLAFTGVSTFLPFFAGIGLVLVVVGTIGRRRQRGITGQ
jgi:hypothetical protein